MYSSLLSPLRTGSFTLPNRVLMAPLTRSRAGQPGDVPTDLNAEYYAQRAGAGEETDPIPEGAGGAADTIALAREVALNHADSA